MTCIWVKKFIINNIKYSLKTKIRVPKKYTIISWIISELFSFSLKSEKKRKIFS